MAVAYEHGWQETLPRIVGEAVLCAAAMALPFLLLGGTYAGMISAGIALFWHNIVGLARKQDGREASAQDSPSDPFATSGWWAAGGVATLAYASLMRWAYAPTAVPSDLQSILNPGFAIPAAPMLLAAGLLAFRLLKWTRGGRPLAAAGPEIRNAWLQAFGGMASLFALMVVLGPPIAFYKIADMVAVDRTPAAWEIFSDYPVLIPAILLAALLAAAAPRAEDSVVRKRTGTAIRAAGYPMGLAILLYGGIHIAVVATTTSVPAFVSATLAGTEAHIWTVEQQKNGMPPAEIAAVLNEHGRPQALQAERGLGALLPDYRSLQAARAPRTDCTIALSAAVADPVELDGMAWPEDLRSYTDPEAPREILDVKYCVAVSCPSIVTGDDRPMRAMYTSHPTRSPGWLLPLRFQLFYPDEELNAGGYCTAYGALADSHQG